MPKSILLHWLTCNLFKIGEYYGIPGVTQVTTEGHAIPREELQASTQEDQLHQTLQQKGRETESAIPIQTEG